MIIFVQIVSSAPRFYFWVFSVLYSLGFLLFLKAKLSLIMRGKLFTFGPKQMSRGNRTFYITGYILMVVTFFLMLGWAGIAQHL